MAIRMVEGAHSMSIQSSSSELTELRVETPAWLVTPRRLTAPLQHAAPWARHGPQSCTQTESCEDPKARPSNPLLAPVSRGPCELNPPYLAQAPRYTALQRSSRPCSRTGPAALQRRLPPSRTTPHSPAERRLKALPTTNSCSTIPDMQAGPLEFCIDLRVLLDCLRTFSGEVSPSRPHSLHLSFRSHPSPCLSLRLVCFYRRLCALNPVTQ